MIHQLLVQLVEDVANIPGQLFFFLKFMFFKKATKLDEMSTLDLTVTKYGQI